MHSLSHFAASSMAPLFEVYKVYDDKSHKAHQALLQDLDAITEDLVSWYLSQSDIRYLLSRKETLIDRKLIVFIEMVGKEIDRLRIKCLLDEDIPLLPYNHSALEGVEPDNNSLVISSAFEIIMGGICRNNEAFTLLPGTHTTNSSYWLSNALFGIQRNDLIKVRLDPLIHEPFDTFNPMINKMQVYGKAFN